jgi:hypothetical protein
MKIHIQLTLFRQGPPVWMKDSGGRKITWKHVEKAREVALRYSSRGGIIRAATVMVDGKPDETYWNPIQERRT